MMENYWIFSTWTFCPSWKKSWSTYCKFRNFKLVFFLMQSVQNSMFSRRNSHFLRQISKISRLNPLAKPNNVFSVLATVDMSSAEAIQEIYNVENNNFDLFSTNETSKSDNEFFVSSANHQNSTILFTFLIILNFLIFIRSFWLTPRSASILPSTSRTRKPKTSRASSTLTSSNGWSKIWISSWKQWIRNNFFITFAFFSKFEWFFWFLSRWKNVIMKSYLEDFYQFVQDIGGATAEVSKKKITKCCL